MDMLTDFKASPYDFEPQEPMPDWVFFKHPVRFLGDDGGIKTGIVVMCLPRGYRPDDMWYYRVLDLRRMQLYTIRGDQLQLMETRKD